MPIRNYIFLTIITYSSELSRWKSKINYKSNSPDLSMFDHTFLDNEMPYYNNRYSKVYIFLNYKSTLITIINQFKFEYMGRVFSFIYLQ